MASSKGGKSANRTIHLKISGAAATIPNGLIAEGKDCAGTGRIYYVAAPSKGVAVLVHEGPTGLHLWKSSKSKDAPVISKKTVAEKVAVAALSSAQKRIPNATGKVSPLKGSWRGYIECHPSGAQVVLYRNVTGYGRIVVVSSLTKGTWEVASVLSDKKWFTGRSAVQAAQKSVKGIGTLNRAMKTGIDLILGLVATACGVQNIVRSPAQRKSANASSKTVTSRKTGATSTKHPVATRKAASTKAAKTVVAKTLKQNALPASLKALAKKKAVLTVATEVGGVKLVKGTLIYIDHAVKSGKTVALRIRTIVPGKDGAKATLSKTVKTIPLYLVSGGKKKRRISLGTTVNANFKYAYAHGLRTVDAVKLAKKGDPKAGKKSAKKAGKKASLMTSQQAHRTDKTYKDYLKSYKDLKKKSPRLVMAEKHLLSKREWEKLVDRPSGKKGSATGKSAAPATRKRLKPNKRQQKISGHYVTYTVGTKENAPKKHGKVLAIEPGGRGGEDWTKAKLTIDVAERGVGSEHVVVSETVFDKNGGRLTPRNSNKAWLAARRKATKAAKISGKAAPKASSRKAASKTNGSSLAAQKAPAALRPGLKSTSATMADLDAMFANL